MIAGARDISEANHFVTGMFSSSCTRGTFDVNDNGNQCCTGEN